MILWNDPNPSSEPSIHGQDPVLSASLQPSR
jgi:hypothetical protein